MRCLPTFEIAAHRLDFAMLSKSLCACVQAHLFHARWWASSGAKNRRLCFNQTCLGSIMLCLIFDCPFSVFIASCDFLDRCFVFGEETQATHQADLLIGNDFSVRSIGIFFIIWDWLVGNDDPNYGCNVTRSTMAEPGYFGGSCENIFHYLALFYDSRPFNNNLRMY